MGSATDKAQVKSFVFDHWLLQGDGTLMRDGHEVHVPPKELKVLRLLLKSSGSVISKNFLLDQVWPEVDAAEESLTRCIYALRKLLRENKAFIATVYGQGYRFNCPVVELVETSPLSRLAPSLAVLPFRDMNDAAALDLQDVLIRQLTLAFGDALHIVPSGLIAYCKQPFDSASLPGRLSADFYVSGRCIDQGEQQQWSVELIRGSDQAFVHGQTLDARDLGEALGALTSLVAQRVPGLRPGGVHCASYPAAVTYLNGMCSLQHHTPQSLRDARVQFRQCLKLDAGYAPSWCGLADVWLGQAMIGLCYQGRAIEEADGAISNALALDSANDAALVRLALLTSLRGCDQAAQVLFRRCLLADDQADVHYFHAWHHWFWRRSEQAAQSIDRCLQHDPDCVRAQVLRVRIALVQSPAHALLSAHRSLQQLRAGNPLLVILNAVLLAYFGEHAAAWHELERAGLVQSAVDELGLAAWNVVFGGNPLIARNQYAKWLSLMKSSPVNGASSPQREGSVVAPLWPSLQRATDTGHRSAAAGSTLRVQSTFGDRRRLA